MKKLAIVTTHPIQYNAPWFRLLAERGNISIKVFYTWSQVQHSEKFDPGFGKNIEWDVPVLEGYAYSFVLNTSQNPGSKSFRGIRNPGLIKEIEEWKADAILVYGWKFQSHLGVMKYFHKKIPVIFRGDSHLLGREKGITNRLRLQILKNAFRNIDFGLYVGRLNKEYFLSSGLKESQLIHCPHTIDLDLFKHTEKSKLGAMEFRKKLGIHSDDLVFLFAGKFEDIKNPFLLLRAANDTVVQNVHFVFVGNGPLEQEIKQEASSHIHFLDFQNQQSMPALYEMCDIYILPSRSETWGLAVNEAMACGKPALVSDTCGCAPDLIEEGVTGFTFKQGDLQSLKEAIGLILKSAHKLKEMGRNAQERVRVNTLEVNAERLEQLVNKIA